MLGNDGCSINGAGGRWTGRMLGNEGCSINGASAGGRATGRMVGNDGCWLGNGGGIGGRSLLRRCLAGGGAGLIAAAGVSGTGIFGTDKLDNDRFGADRFGIAVVGGSIGSDRTGSGRIGSARTTGTGAVIGSTSGRAIGIECIGGRAGGTAGREGGPASGPGLDGMSRPAGGTGPRGPGPAGPTGGLAGAGGRAIGWDICGPGTDMRPDGCGTGICLPDICGPAICGPAIRGPDGPAIWGTAICMDTAGTGIVRAGAGISADARANAPDACAIAGA